MTVGTFFINEMVKSTTQLAIAGFFFFGCCFVMYWLALMFGEHPSGNVIFFYKNTTLVSYSIMIGVFVMVVGQNFAFAVQNSNLFFSESTNQVTTLTLQGGLSVTLIYLCYVVGLVSTTTLGERAWTQTPLAPAGMLYFPPVIALLGLSTSLLELFVYYELILLPSVVLVHKLAYSARANQSVFFFFVWTQTGSLLVLLPTSYLYFSYVNLEFVNIKHMLLSTTETYMIYIFFFFGFGVKVPVWPLHYWLIKVHVEAPSGFSIFLSGFLVKTGVFCFFVCTSLLPTNDYFVFPLFFCVIGIVDSSLKLWAQEDIKKLIAYCTVQEMNIIYLLFNLGSSDMQLAGCFFIVAHSFLSSLMFFLVDCVYRRAGTRSISKTAGLSARFPVLSASVWAMLVFFWGLPGTAKFFAEINFFFFAIELDVLFGCFLLFFVVVLGSMGFAKNWFSLLYGQPQGNDDLSLAATTEFSGPVVALDLTKLEISVVFLLSFLSIVANFSFFFCLYHVL